MSDLLTMAKDGNLIGIRKFVSDGGNLNETDFGGRDALMWAAKNGHGDCVAELAGLISAQRRDNGKMTALMYAAANGQADCVDILIPLSDVNAMDMSNTALGKAVRYGHIKCVKSLLKVARCDTVTRSGYTLLMEVIDDEKTEMVETLLPYSNPNAQNNDKKTAIMLAIMHGQVECFKMLLPVSDLKKRDINEMTAREIAKDEGRHDLVAMIDSFLLNMGHDDLPHKQVSSL